MGDLGESIDHPQEQQAQSAGASVTQGPVRVGLRADPNTPRCEYVPRPGAWATDHTSIPLEPLRIRASRQAPLASECIDDVG
jgi:hypothetical protein